MLRACPLTRAICNLLTRPADNEAMNMSFEKMCVLVVDDIAMTRDLVYDMLKHLGVGQVFKAGDGEEALGLIKASGGLISAVFCDWNMPGMSGMDVVHAIRKEGIDIPFIFITGRDDMDSLNEARQAGIDSYILKPCSPQQLKEKLDHVASRPVVAASQAAATSDPAHPAANP